MIFKAKIKEDAADLLLLHPQNARSLSLEESALPKLLEAIALNAQPTFRTQGLAQDVRFEKLTLRYRFLRNFKVKIGNFY